MLFNSFVFIIFLISVFILYWLIPSRKMKMRNAFLLTVSYVFYGWWDWRFLILIIISSLVDYILGLRMAAAYTHRRRKRLMAVSLIVNLGILWYFKYYNFFIDSFIVLSNTLGIKAHPTTLSIILPVGISFYTLQTLSYTIDVYRKKIDATRDWLAFFAFVTFFPQLVAGPIERAAQLLPQFFIPKRFDTLQAKDGMRQIAWGLVQKIVIADSCAPYVQHAFEHYTTLSGYELLMGVVLFGFQIYGDFAGYSNIAIGSAKLFGFQLMKNFNYPYFSANIHEFWNRWHISLSSWFRDYVYIPLGGNRVAAYRHYANVMIVFLVSGLWHGAQWTFVVWGLCHAVYLISYILYRKATSQVHLPLVLRHFGTFLGSALTFLLVSLAWTFFRSPSLTVALEYLKAIYTGILSAPRHIWSSDFWFPYEPYSYIILIFLIIEFAYRHRDYAFQWYKSDRLYPVRWIVYLLLVVLTIIYGQFEKNEFIYFAF